MVGRSRPSSNTTNGSNDANFDNVYRAIGALTQVVEQQTYVGCTVEQFKQLNPPIFKGIVDPVEAEAWMLQIEKCFDVLGCTEVQKVPFATFMLEGETEHWWRTAKRILEDPLSWKAFRDAFYDKFFPESIRDQKEAEFMNLTQGSMTVTSYEAKFTELSCFTPYIVEDEARKVTKFERGLRAAIRTRLSALKLRTYALVVDRALIV